VAFDADRVRFPEDLVHFPIFFADDDDVTLLIAVVHRGNRHDGARGKGDR
jgi:hypothetical protein